MKRFAVPKLTSKIFNKLTVKKVNKTKTEKNFILMIFLHFQLFQNEFDENFSFFREFYMKISKDFKEIEKLKRKSAFHREKSTQR